ncbi:hypothetical protein ACRBEV_32630 (plasmid) [Methylobacterium phyllosphaerae]
MTRKLLLSLTIAASVVLTGAPTFAADVSHSGEWTAEFTKRETRPLDGPDHILVAGVAAGTNRSTGSETFGDGAQVLIADTAELNQGNGPQSGFFTLVDGKGSLTSAYTGRVNTKMVDGQPRTTSEGTWHHVSGTGAYANVKENGRYSFTMTSPTAMRGEWVEATKAASR